MAVSVGNVVATVCIPVVVYLCALLMERRSGARKAEDHEGTRRGTRKYTQVFWAMFGVYQVYVDYTWLFVNWVWLSRTATRGREYTLSRDAVVLFTAACGCIVVANAWALNQLMRRLTRSSMRVAKRTLLQLQLSPPQAHPRAAGPRNPLGQWRQQHRNVFWCVALASCFKLSIFQVIYCRAFGARVFSAPLPLDGAEGRRNTAMIQRYVSVVTLIEDLPHLVAVFVASTAQDKWSSYVDASTLVVSALSLLLSAAKTMDLLCCSGEDAADDAGADATPARSALSPEGDGGGLVRRRTSTDSGHKHNASYMLVHSPASQLGTHAEPLLGARA